MTGQDEFYRLTSRVTPRRIAKGHTKKVTPITISWEKCLIDEKNAVLVPDPSPEGGAAPPRNWE